MKLKGNTGGCEKRQRGSREYSVGTRGTKVEKQRRFDRKRKENRVYRIMNETE